MQTDRRSRKRFLKVDSVEDRKRRRVAMKCRHCGKEVVQVKDKPGYIDECPNCATEDMQEEKRFAENHTAPRAAFLSASNAGKKSKGRIRH